LPSVSHEGIIAAVRVLAVEDDTRLADLLRQGLEEDGMIVDLVRSGEEATDAALTTTFDVMSLDLMIPARMASLSAPTYAGRRWPSPS